MGPLGWQETLFIFLLALLIFGPKKLPELGRNIGKAITEFRRASSELKATFDREMSSLERESQEIQEVARGYEHDYSGYDYNYNYNYDSSYYDSGSDSYSAAADLSASEDSTAASPATASASATQGAESEPGATVAEARETDVGAALEIVTGAEAQESAQAGVRPAGDPPVASS